MEFFSVDFNRVIDLSGIAILADKRVFI